MKKKTIVLFSSFALVLCCGISWAASKWKAAATTSLIAEAAARVGGDRVEVITLLPPRACPGHFDMDAKTLSRLASCRLLMMHGWEKWASGDVPPRRALATKGNWMAPAVQFAAVQEIADLFCREDPEGCAVYADNASHRRAELDALEKELMEKSRRFKGVPVLCAWPQEDFLKSLGFDVAATYNGMETLTVQEAARVLKAGRERHARCVVDNLQSGEGAGMAVAEELKVPHVVITNFPLEKGYEASLRDNLRRLEEALHD